MPNGTTTILPSATGGGLTQGMQNFVNARLARKQLDLQERTVALDEQTQAMERLKSILPWLQRDQPLPPEIHPLLVSAIPQFSDLTPEQIARFDVSPETASHILDTMIVDLLQDPNTPDSLKERLMISQVAGRPATGAELQAEGEAGVAEAGVRKGMAEIAAQRLVDATPYLQEQVASRIILGQVPMRVEFGGNTFEFESTDAAQIYLGMARLTNEAAAASLSAEVSLARLNADERQRVYEGLQEMGAKVGIGVSRTVSDQILDAYELTVSGKNPGAWKELIELYEQKKADNSLWAAQAFWTAMDTSMGEQYQLFKGSEAALDFARSMSVVGWLKEETGKEGEELFEQTDILLRFLETLKEQGADVDLFNLVGDDPFFGKMRLNFVSPNRYLEGLISSFPDFDELSTQQKRIFRALEAGYTVEQIRLRPNVDEADLLEAAAAFQKFKERNSGDTSEETGRNPGGS